MINVLSLNDPLQGCSSEQLCHNIAPLQRQGIDLLCCQSIAHNLTSCDSTAADDSRQLSKVLGLTCSCFAAGKHTDAAGTLEEQHTLNGLAILTGTGVWTLNSGSFVVGEGDCEEVVLFALVRKNGNSVLVLNLHLSPLAEQQEMQLAQLFQNSLLREAYGAVVLSANRAVSLGSKRWQSLSGPSLYGSQHLLSAPAGGDGLLCLLTPRFGAASEVAVHQSRIGLGANPEGRPVPGLAFTLDIKRCTADRRSRPSFPLSFREQWLGYRDSRAFA